MDSETKTITGVCTEIAQKPGNDWVEFHVDGGGQYPVKLSTKLQPLIELGRAVGQQLATWAYEESQGNPNPNRPGSFYMNRYLSKVEVGGTQNAPDATEGTAAPALGAAKDRLIVRQTCIKAAAELYAGQGFWSLTKDENLTDTTQYVIDAAARFEKWVVMGILEPVPFQ